MRRIAVLDAPSNLGLRPPTPSSVPGCSKAPGALRDHGLVARLGARDAGCHTPPRYDPGEWRPGDGVSQAGDIAGYSVRLADRIGAIVKAEEFPLVLGGDCSIVLGSALAMRRLGEDRGGRVGLVYVDAHSDFRHPGNASVVGAAAGEALALVTGRGQADLAGIEQRRPYVRDSDVVLVGLRAVRRVPDGPARRRLLLPDRPGHPGTRRRPYRPMDSCRSSAECIGFWVHLDVDVLDPSVMPAVDAPDPGGIAYPELEVLLRGLVGDPGCVGMEVTVFDPDFDAEGAYAADLVSTLVTALSSVHDSGGTVSSITRGQPLEPVEPPTAPVIPAQSKRHPRTRRAAAPN